MKYLKKYALFEADKPATYPNSGNQKRDNWFRERTIPSDMQSDIVDMSWELKDEGYDISYQWWSPYEQHHMLYEDNKYPSISIRKSNKQTEGLEKIYYGHIKDFCDRVIFYLDSRGYNGVVKFRKEGYSDYYNIDDSDNNWGPFGDYPMCMSIHYKIEMIDRQIWGDIYE